MKKAKYLVEYYKDEYNSLHQAIKIDLEEDKYTNGMSSNFMRNMINPNLTIFYERIYEDENRIPIKIERLIKNEWVELDVNTFKPIVKDSDK